MLMIVGYLYSWDSNQHMYPSIQLFGKMLAVIYFRPRVSLPGNSCWYFF